MSNPNPKYKFRNDQVGEVARRSISVKLPPELDAFVRSLPNRAEWLRQAIAAQVERDLQKESSVTNAGVNIGVQNINEDAGKHHERGEKD